MATIKRVVTDLFNKSISNMLTDLIVEDGLLFEECPNVITNKNNDGTYSVEIHWTRISEISNGFNIEFNYDPKKQLGVIHTLSIYNYLVKDELDLDSRKVLKEFYESFLKLVNFWVPFEVKHLR